MIYNQIDDITEYMKDEKEAKREEARIYHAKMSARKGDYSNMFLRLLRAERRLKRSKISAI